MLYIICYTQYFYLLIFIYKEIIMSKEMRNHIESFKNFKLNESNQIGKVYFNAEKYPGFMYVKEILPKYQMYWIGTETDEVIPTQLVKDEEMDLYWLKSPDGNTFAYEIFKHENGYFILDLLEPQELNKYLRDGGEWFPSDKG